MLARTGRTTLPTAIQPPFFPVRCKSLALPPAPCHHWPMSQRATNSPPSSPLNRASLARRKSARTSHARLCQGTALAVPIRRPFTSSYRAAFLPSARPLTGHGPRATSHVHFAWSPPPFNPNFSPFAANRLPRRSLPCYHWPMSARTSNSPPPPPWNSSSAFPSHSPLATSHCSSNRNTSKLKFLVTHTKQSPAQFLIATFRAFATIPVQYWLTLKNEGRAPSAFPEARKLENRSTRFFSATSIFLIDNFQRDSGGASIKGLAGARSVLFSSHSPLATRHCFPRLIEFLWGIRN